MVHNSDKLSATFGANFGDKHQLAYGLELFEFAVFGLGLLLVAVCGDERHLGSLTERIVKILNPGHILKIKADEGERVQKVLNLQHDVFLAIMINLFEITLQDASVDDVAEFAVGVEDDGGWLIRQRNRPLEHIGVVLRILEVTGSWVRFRGIEEASIIGGAIF